MCLGREEDKKPRYRARANKRALLIKVRRPVLEIDPPTSGRHFYRLRVWLTRASNEKILWHRGEKERVSVLDQPIFESLEIFPLRLNLPLNPFSSLSLSFFFARSTRARIEGKGRNFGEGRNKVRCRSGRPSDRFKGRKVCSRMDEGREKKKIDEKEEKEGR